MSRRPIGTDEILSWMELDFWQLAEAGGMDDGPSRDDVIDFVQKSVEPGLRDGRLVLGRVMHAPPKVGFDPIHVPVDDQLKMIRDALSTEGEINLPELDLWFGPGESDSTPPDSTSDE